MKDVESKVFAGVQMDMDDQSFDSLGSEELQCMSPSTLKSKLQSIRKQRNLAHQMPKGVHKTRGFVGSDKLVWKDGTVDTFDAFARDVKGTLTKLGMAYLLKPEVIASYQLLGLEIADDPAFYDAHGISRAQLRHNVEYFFGLLQCATKDFEDSNIIAQEDTMDGLCAWLGLVEEHVHNGAKELKLKDLDALITTDYRKADFKSVVDYVAQFLSWCQQVKAICTKHPQCDSAFAKDRHCRRALLKNLDTKPTVHKILDDCLGHPEWDLRECAKCIRADAMRTQRCEKKMSLQTQNSFPQQRHLLHTHVQSESDTNAAEDTARNVIQEMVNTCGVRHAFATFNNSKVRASLSIPDRVWAEFGPELQDQVLEAKQKARQKLQEEQDSKPAATPSAQQQLPAQYPNQVNMTQHVDNIISSINKTHLTGGDSDTDDDCFRITMTRTCMDNPAPNPNKSNHMEIKVSADRIVCALQSTEDESVWVYSDGCANSCVAGKMCKVLSTVQGRTASLQGCDPCIFQSGRLPIVTCAVKVRDKNGFPVICIFNETPYNEGCPMFIMSEYQVREHGFIVDSVARKHLRAPGEHGTQTLYLSPEVQIPMVDRGGIMGMEMFPVNEDFDLNRLDPNVDVFELTSPERWIPSQFRVNHTLNIRQLQKAQRVTSIPNTPSETPAVEGGTLDKLNDEPTIVGTQNEGPPPEPVMEEPVVLPDPPAVVGMDAIQLRQAIGNPVDPVIPEAFNPGEFVIPVNNPGEQTADTPPVQPPIGTVEPGQIPPQPPLLFEKFIPFEPEEHPFDVEQLHAAHLTTEWTDVDAMLDAMSFDKLIGAHHFVPESFGFPELELEHHEQEIMFHPDPARAVCLKIKLWQQVFYPRVDPASLRKFLGWRPLNIIKKKLQCTTQLAKSYLRYPM